MEVHISLNIWSCVDFWLRRRDRSVSLEKESSIFLFFSLIKVTSSSISSFSCSFSLTYSIKTFLFFNSLNFFSNAIFSFNTSSVSNGADFLCGKMSPGKRDSNSFSKKLINQMNFGSSLIYNLLCPYYGVNIKYRFFFHFFELFST